MSTPSSTSSLPPLPNKLEIENDCLVKLLMGAKKAKGVIANCYDLMKIVEESERIDNYLNHTEIMVLKIFCNGDYFIILGWSIGLNKFVAVNIDYYSEKDIVHETIQSLYSRGLVLNGACIYTPKNKFFVNIDIMRKGKCDVIKLVQDKSGDYFEPRNPDRDFEIDKNEHDVYINEHLISK